MSTHTHVVIDQPYQQIDVKRIVRNPEQPRIIFDEAELNGLAESIKEHDVIQPIVVEACGEDYILHDGERRWLASMRAGKSTVPAFITPPLNGTGPRERLERALVANIQRVEMHPIEEGRGYQRLINEFGYSVKEVAKRTGKHRTRIGYCLKLLTLDEPIQQLMLQRKLPCEEIKVLNSLLSIENTEDRITLATVLAERNATAKMIERACQQFNQTRSVRMPKRKQGSPAVLMVNEKWPEWDALYQLGKVPPWPVINDAVMKTCDNCPLRKMASDTTCRDCALVVFLNSTLESIHAHR